MKEESLERGLKELWFMFYATCFMGWTQLLKGIEFFRCVENFWFFYTFQQKDIAGKKIMDVGPWKSPLPVYLSAYHLCDVTVVDISGGIKQQMYYAAMSKTTIKSCEIPKMSADSLVGFDGIPSNEFDIVTCISTLEHFEGDLDVGVVNEMHRVLKPNGYLFITVPYGQLFHESVHYIWTEKRHSTASISKLFRDKFYLDEQYYFKDKNTLKFTNKYWSLPRVVRLALGRSWIFFAEYYIRRDKAAIDNASLTGLVMRKK